MNEKVKKMGILGCAAITSMSIIKPLKSLANIHLYAIASSSYERTQKYALEYGIPKVFQNYSELLQCEDIDFVYIPLSNDLHMEWAIHAAEAKKHILLEKPACLNPEDFLKVIEACKRNKVILLEALMLQHHPWQDYLVDFTDHQTFGRLLTIKTHASFVSQRSSLYNYKTHPESGYGVFYDLGPYWLQFLQLFDNITSAEYEGYSSFNGPNDCDWTFLSSLELKEGFKSEFISSYELPYQATHELIFENGAIRIQDFLKASFGKFKIKLEIEDYQVEKKEVIVFPPQNYYTNQLSFFSDVLDGKQENIDPMKTYERILLMSQIYNRAKQESRKWCQL